MAIRCVILRYIELVDRNPEAKKVDKPKKVQEKESKKQVDPQAASK